MKNYSNIEDAVKQVKKGSFLRLSMLTEPNMNKRNNPFYGKVKKITTLKNAVLGVDYANLMQNAAKRSGNEPTEKYKVEKGKTGDWVKGFEKIISMTEIGKKYLHVYSYQGVTSSTICYLFENNIITNDNPLFNEIASYDKSYKKKVETCAKQATYGIENKQVPRVMTVTLTNVIAIKQGEINFQVGF